MANPKTSSPSQSPSQSPSTIPGSDFYALGAPKRQCNCLVFGDGGTGKSTLGTLYAPDPVAFINFDRRAHYAVRKAMDLGRRIHYTEVPKPGNVTSMTDEVARRAGQAAVDHTVRNFELAVRESQKGNVRTVVLDTGTEFSECIKLALTGRIDKVKGDFGKSKDLLNRQWWQIFETAREGFAHLIVLARAKAIWVNNEPTGLFTYRGPEVMYDAVDWAGEMRLKKTKKGATKKEFELEIKKAGVNIEELGAVYTAEDWSDLGGPFVYSCLLQYEGSTEEDWK